MDERGRKPLLPGRGVLRIEDFPRATGLEQATVEALATQGEVEGLVRADGRVIGVFDDVLPTAQQLDAMGLAVSSDYDPASLRSSDVTTEDPDGPGGSDDAGPSGSWTIAWGDEESRAPLSGRGRLRSTGGCSRSRRSARGRSPTA